MTFKPLLAALATLSLSTSGVTLAQGHAPAAPAFTPEAFRAHVDFLADDLLEGREAGTRGYDIAARYVATQFEALGLRPAANGSWFQPAEFVRYSIAGTPRMTIGGRVFAQGEDVLVRPTPDPAPLALDAEMVFAGYGLDLPAQGYDDYAGLDVRGKVVVVFSGYPEGTATDVGAHLNSQKARMAAARGAAGLIILRSRREIETTPWSRLITYGARPSTTWIDREGRPYGADGLGFTAYAEGTAAAALFVGARRPLERLLDEVARGERPRGFALTQTLRVERDGAGEDRFESENVVAILPGTDPALANEYVLLMAHLDGLGVRPPADGDTADTDRIRNGAMDNATGISTLIEVARAMSEPGNRPRRPVLIAAVTAEEKGLLGAEFLARNPVVNGRIVGLVNLDMPVLTYDFQDVIAFGAEHSTLGPIVRRAAARMNVALAADPLPQESLFVRSDHYKFVLEGVPAVFLMTGFGGEGRERFTGFLDEFYHSPEDDMELPFNWTAGARFAQLNYLIAREIADGPEAPRWYADSFFGRTLANGQQMAERPAGESGSATAR